MGTVYEAIDERLDNTVALKETLFTDERLRKQFEREARLLARLHHPALPKVFDHFTEGDGQFLIMQFIPGEDLWEMLRQRKAAFTQEEVLNWGDQLLDALDYLHSQEPSIVHRDIKPQNLKIARRKQIILLDFGLAKGFAGQVSRVTTSGSIFGFTPNFAPLEQIQGEGTDPRSDLYGLAATLYLMMTDIVPPDALKRITAIANGDDDPLRPANEMNAQVSGEIAQWLQRAMTIARNKRPANAQAMRDELEDIRRSGAVASTLILPRKAEERAQAGTTTKESGVESNEEMRSAPVDESEKPEPLASAPIPSTVVSPPEPQRQPIRRDAIQPPAPAATIASSKPALPQRHSQPAPAREPSYFSEPQEVPRSGSKKLLFIAGLLVVVGIVMVLMFRGSREERQSTGSEADSNTIPTQTTPGAPTGMVYVPGGEFTMGRNDGDDYERPAHKVVVNPFFMDTYEVTNQEYASFVFAKHAKPPSSWTEAGMYPSRLARYPVTGVTWNEAKAYAEYAGKRLPTEDEWEFAARGTDGRRYPWGNTWTDGSANVGAAGSVTPGNGYAGMENVGTYKNTPSPYGIYDLTGNAWEWTASTLKAYPGGTLPAEANTNDKVIRGGSWASSPLQATTTFRRGWGAASEKDYSYTGFRCAKDVRR